MAYVIPNTTCRLYSGVDVVMGMQELFFSSEANKIAYFNSKAISTTANMTYMRKGGERIRLDVNINTVLSCNYLSFVNINHENKTFYCYIYDYEYVNEGSTDIYFVVDEWLTFCHDANFKMEDCIVVKQHTNLAEYTAERANPYRNDLPFLSTSEALSVSKEDELPRKLLASMITDDFTGLDSKYSWSDYGPYGLRSDGVSGIGDQPHNCYVVLFGGQFEEEETLAVLRLAESNHAPSEFYNGNPESAHVAAQVFQDNYAWAKDKVPEIFNLFDDFIAPSYRDGTLEPFYIGWIDIDVNPHSEEYLSDKEPPLNRMVAVQNYFTLNDAVSSIIGIYQLPKYMVEFEYQVKSTDIEYDDEKVSEERYVLQLSSTTGHAATLGMGLNASLPQMTNNLFLRSNPTDHFNIAMPCPTAPVANYKLKRAPFSYIRAVAPNGDTKEYFYENFTDLMQAESVSFSKTSHQPTAFPVFFRIVCNLAGQPTMSLVPFDYKYNGDIPVGGIIGMLTTDMYQLNPQERLEFTEYPQLGFMTDGYTSYLASKYNEIQARHSVSEQTSHKEMLNRKRLENAKGIASAITDNIGDIKTIGSQIPTMNLWASQLTAASAAKNIAGRAGNIAETAMNTYYTEKNEKNYQKEIAEADKRGDFNGHYEDTMFVGTRPGMVGDAYKAGDSFGYNKYQMSLPSFWESKSFVLQVIELNPSLLAIYDDYFTNYGYTYNTLGTPNIYKALKGEAGSTLHFNSKGFIYTQTAECKVTGIYATAAKNISSMFDNGLRFMNGDALLPS